MFFRRHPAGDRLVAANFGRWPTTVSVAVPSPSLVDQTDAPRGEVNGSVWSADVPAQTVWVLRAP